MIGEKWGNEEIIIAFGFTLLETSNTQFPYSNTSHEISENDRNIFNGLLTRHEDSNLSLKIKLLQIEIAAHEKEIEYQKLLLDAYYENDIDRWRIQFGLGIFHYKNGNFDQAVIHLKQAQILFPENSLIVDLLIQSYIQLDLPNEIIKIVNLQQHHDSLTIKNLLDYSEYMFSNLEFKMLLESAEKEYPSDEKYSLAEVKSLIKEDNIQKAEKRLIEIEKNRNLGFDYLPLVAQFYLDCSSQQSAKRVIEKYLSLKDNLSNTNLIEAASIYYQLNEFDKSLGLINSY